MILSVVRVAFLNFLRDRVALLLTFVLPIVFFSIFAFVFGGVGGDGVDRVKLAVADEDNSEASKRFIAALQADKSLDVRLASADKTPKRYDRAAVRELVSSGKLSAGLVVPKGFSESFGFFGGNEAGVECELMVDRSDPIAGPMAAGLLQRAAMTAAPELMIERGVEMLEKYVLPLTPAQREAFDRQLPQLRHWLGVDASALQSASAPESKSAGDTFSGPVRVKIVDVIAERDNKPMIAFYAAGTGVMFLLFMAAGAGGALLEEEESGVLQRLLNSRLTMTELLLGKWLLIATVGALQVLIMFAWGAAIFGLPLFSLRNFTGFAIMTAVTASAAASFGLILATACRSRAQLGGLSTIVILVMSAVGGSMVPRFLMPEGMKMAGYATFNAWALDGYQKVFWWNVPLYTLWPQVLVLSLLTIVFLIVARLLARRWEHA